MKMKRFNHHLFSVIVAILCICCFATTFLAVWDGEGDSTGGNGSAVTGGFSLPTTDA